MTETEQVFTQQDIEKALQAVNKVADSVSKSEWNYERLKAKREKLLLQAVIAYWKSISLKDDFLYPIRLSYSTYEYDCGMLNENLTRELINLDSVNSNGNEDIRQQRKTQVKRKLATYRNHNHNINRNIGRMLRANFVHALFYPPAQTSTTNCVPVTFISFLNIDK